MRRKIVTIKEVDVYQDEDTKKVEFTACAHIDADGANSQHGGVAAYRSDNKGSELLANGGMKIKDGKVVWAADWGKDIVLVKNGLPMVLDDGTIPSKTSYKFPDVSPSDPSAYVDAETVPYAVVSPLIRNLSKGVVLGCQCKITHIPSGKSVMGGVFDIGPRNKIGELSIAAARAIGLPSSPRNGGTEEKIIKYELFPDEPAEVNGVKYTLIPT